MRKLFTIALVALLLGVGIVAVIETDPGYVLLSYGNYTLEASLWVGLLLLVLLLLSVYLLFRLVHRIVGGQRTLFSWLGARKARKSQRLSTRGLISFAEGNWAIARRQLLRGVQNNEAPLVNYLLAARSSAQLQDPDKVHEYLTAATDVEPAAAVAAEVTLAEIKLQAEEYEQAVALLTQSTSSAGRHPYGLSLLSRAYQGLKDWDKLLDLLPQLQRQKLLTSDAFHQLERRVHYNNLQQRDSDLAQLHAAWQKVPKPLQHDAAIVEVYARNLMKLEDNEAAERALFRALKQQWQPALVRLYGCAQSSNAKRQLSHAESWLKTYPEEPQLLMCLGRLSARNKLWGKAREYFESSYRFGPGAEICAELGRLLTSLGEPKAAAAYFREGLMLCEDELPDLAVPEKITLEG
jgi:HemY protein